MNIQEFIPREKARADCYRFLSACFYQPRKDAFIQEGFFNSLAASLNIVSQEASVIASKLEEAFSGYEEEEITVDYAKLFVGPNELIAPPYGSVYLDKERRVMGDSTMKVIAMYQQAGLSMSEGFNDVPDHISAELEFMYYLIFKEIEALEGSDIDKAEGFMKMQEEFMHRFLGKWAIPFCKRIQEGTENRFYNWLAGCIVEFIRAESAGDGIPDAIKIKAAVN